MATTLAAAAKKTANVAAKAPAAKAPAGKGLEAKPTAAKADAKVPKAKAKLVRDSFTMPAADFDLIALMKRRALGFQRPAKKSELLRAGLHALHALDDTRLREALDALVALKPGRPKKAA